jgi:hypothetical protein
MLEVPRRSSVVISELDDNSGSSLTSSESDALNSDLAQLGFISESQSIPTGNSPVWSDVGLSDGATYENDQSDFSEGSSSLIPLPDQPAISRTGRAKKKNTSHVETQVRRSTRLHNNGVFVSLPNSTRRRASSVPRASTPAVIQITEMQRMGTEECLIDPAELTAERLLQDSSSED